MAGGGHGEINKLFFFFKCVQSYSGQKPGSKAGVLHCGHSLKSSQATGKGLQRGPWALQLKSDLSLSSETAGREEGRSGTSHWAGSWVLTDQSHNLMQRHPIQVPRGLF